MNNCRFIKKEWEVVVSPSDDEETSVAPQAIPHG